MTRVPRLDFMSALFLNLRHSSDELPEWSSLTTGLPAAVSEHAAARRIATTVARSHGAEAGLVTRSTLHAFVDVFSILPRPGDIIAVDEGAYPTLQYAGKLGRRQGVEITTFPHHRPEAVRDNGRRLIVVTDGWCGGCNRPAPLARLKETASMNNGLLVVDDSLAYGVLGQRCGTEGFGDGSGTLRWLRLDHDGVLWCASLAKGFGAPVAVLSGPDTAIRPLRSAGSRLHASPPSSPDLQAGWRALTSDGLLHRRRRRLWENTMSLRSGLLASGMPVAGAPFPVVAIPMAANEAHRWWQHLRRNAVDALVQLPRCRPGAQLSFVVRSDHTRGQIDRAINLMRQAREGIPAA